MKSSPKLEICRGSKYFQLLNVPKFLRTVEIDLYRRFGIELWFRFSIYFDKHKFVVLEILFIK